MNKNSCLACRNEQNKVTTTNKIYHICGKNDLFWSDLEDYMYFFAWNYGRYYHVGDADKILEIVGEKMILPKEFIKEIKEKYSIKNKES